MNLELKKLLEFGILNIDKSSGPTSFNISDFIRKKMTNLGVRKTSHFGTLDPKVTGVLPIALNRACKLTGYFLGHDKEYIGVMKLHEEIELGKIQKVIDEKFIGKIKQVPPVRSSVKRREREREIKKFEILEKDGLNLLFSVECEGGTYIRKLIHDLGKELGVGAHMLELRRIRAGIFSEENSINLYEFERAVEDEEKLKKIIIPAEEAIKKIYPIIKIKKECTDKVLQGQPIYLEELTEKKDYKKDLIIAAFCEEKFIGIYKVINEKRMFAKSEFVMQQIK